MEITINLEYDQLLRLVKQLPKKDKKRLTLEIEKEIKKKDKSSIKTTKADETNEFQRLLLRGPVMTDDQFNDFKEFSFFLATFPSIRGKRI